MVEQTLEQLTEEATRNVRLRTENFIPVVGLVKYLDRTDEDIFSRNSDLLPPRFFLLGAYNLAVGIAAFFGIYSVLEYFSR